MNITHRAVQRLSRKGHSPLAEGYDKALEDAICLEANPRSASYSEYNKIQLLICQKEKELAALKRRANIIWNTQ